jgi:hypothetical protein
LLSPADIAAPRVTLNLNRLAGFGLVAAGFLALAWLDPRSFGGATEPSAEIAARQAQLSVLRLGLLQLVVGSLVGRLTATHAQVVLAGALAELLGRLAGQDALGIAGALAMATALMHAAAVSPAPKLERALLSVLGGGALIDLVLIAPPVALGALDALPLRMLRLADIATVALPALTVLHLPLAAAAPAGALGRRFGAPLMVLGSAGLPLILVLSATVLPIAKYLLWIPADAVLIGTVLSAGLARRGPRLELFAWTLIAASMVLGLLMGGYAFDGPLPAPAPLAEYGALMRRLLRAGHSDAMTLSLLGIFASRALPEGQIARRGRALVAIAGLVTLFGLGLFGLALVPAPILAVGPALAAGSAGFAMLESRKNGEVW